MTLSGNLGFVPIDEILRLLTRSKQQGAVEVSGNGMRGRVFVGKGGIDLAATAEDDALHRHLVNSGYAEENALRRVTTGETTLAALAESNQAIVDLLREMTVESLFQISDRGGDFQVKEGASTPYASPKSFELEALLNDASERSREWAKVSEVVPDLRASIGLRRDLGDRDEVSVRSDDWKVLSEVGTGTSVHEIADHLGTTEFWTARVVARLINNGLVEIGLDPATEERSQPETPTPPARDEYHGEPSYDETSRVEREEYAEPEPVESAHQEVFAQETAETEHDDAHDEPWWQEPENETEPVEDEPRIPEVVRDGLSEIPAVQAVEQPEGSDDSDDVEEDTEAFLEKVFSELDANKTESDEGHGLLRRRRMGTLRDFSSDS